MPGLDIAPVRALRYTAAAGDLTELVAPPYDVISAEEQLALESRSSHNVVRLILPRDPGGSPEAKYQLAVKTLRSWRKDQILAADPQPTLYIYEISHQNHRTRGLVGTLELTPFNDGIVLPHEDTMPGPIADRLALLEATHANFEPIVLIHQNGPSTANNTIQKIVDNHSPLIESTGSDGNFHRIWAITDQTDSTTIIDDLHPQTAVIADGHHRYTTYLRYQALQRERGAGPGPWDRILVFLADAGNNGPILHATHRVIPHFPISNAIDLCHENLRITPITGGKANAAELLEHATGSADTFVMTDGSDWYLLTNLSNDVVNGALSNWNILQRNIAARVADVVVIQQMWGIHEGQQVDYQHDLDTAIALAQSNGGTALLLPAATVEQVLTLAQAGERMPRKSTLFTPKPLSGFLMRDYADEIPH